MIHGYGFDETPSANRVHFETDALSTDPIRIPGHSLSQDNEFKSAVSNGKLHYSTPSMLDLASGMTQEQLRLYDSINTELQVDVTKEDTGLTHSYVCDHPSSDCNVNYSWDYTPIVWFASPPVVYHGLTSSVYLNPKNAPNYKGDRHMAVEIRLDGTFLDTFEHLDFDENLPTNTNTMVSGTVRNEGKSKDLDYSVRFRGAGLGL